MKNLTFLIINCAAVLVIVLATVFNASRQSTESVKPINSDVVDNHIALSFVELETEMNRIPNELLDTLVLKNLNFPLLVVRLNGSECQPCLDQLYSDIKMLLVETALNNIVLVVNGISEVTNYTLKSIVGSEIQFVNYESLGLHIDSFNSTFFLLIDDKGIINKCYIYRKELPILNKSAIENLIRRASIGSL